MAAINFSRIGFWLPEGLPNKEYTISDGLVSVVLDRSGGINCIEYHGPRRLPVRRAAFFSHGIWRKKDFFPEPVIYFSVVTDAGEKKAVFSDVSLCPYGISSSFPLGKNKFFWEIWVRKQTVLIQFTSLRGKSSVSLHIDERFLNYYNEYSSWEEPVFDHECNGLRYNLRSNFLVEFPPEVPDTHRRHEACCLVSCLSPVRCQRQTQLATMSANLYEGQILRFVFAFGEDIHQVAACCQEAAYLWEKWAQEQFEKYYKLSKSTPVLKIDGAPVLGEIIRTTPVFLRSLVRDKNPVEAGFRAGTRGYGIWNGWDGQWVCRVLNACRDWETVKKYLNFLDSCRGPNKAVAFALDYDFGPLYDINLHYPSGDRQPGAGWTIVLDCWALENIHEYYFQTGDIKTLKKHYEKAASVLKTICSHAGPEGLVESCFGGADYSHQVNRPQFPDPRDNRVVSSRLSGVEDTGILYHACQIGAELASLLQDEETLLACLNLSEKIEQNFIKHFFDEEEGFLLDCVWPKERPVFRNRFFRLTSLLALSGYGELLCLDQWDRLADFIWRKLRHPVIGLREVPVDQVLPDSGRNRKEDWLQNAARETLRVARLAGQERLLHLILDRYQNHFKSEKVIRENLYNNEAKEFFQSGKLHVSTSWWQGMTGSAWWFGILEAVAGLRFSRGQLEYIPGQFGEKLSLSNLHFAKRSWDITVEGKGKWVSEFVINGKKRDPFTYQLQPADLKRRQQVLIKKTDRPPAYPVILSAGASLVNHLYSASGVLKVSLTGPGFSRIWFFSPEKPVLLVGGKEHFYSWSEKRREGSAAILYSKDTEITLFC